MALSLLLLEELVAGVGAGQEEPETLQERAWGSRSAVSGIFYPTALLRDTTLIPNPAPGVAGHTGCHPGTHTVFQQDISKEGVSPSPAPGRTNNCKKGFLGGLVLHFAPRRSRDGSGDRYLLIKGGDEGDEFIHVAHGQPLRVNLHRRLHFLGVKKIPDRFGHPPAGGPGEQREQKADGHRTPLQDLPPASCQGGEDTSAHPVFMGNAGKEAGNSLSTM